MRLEYEQVEESFDDTTHLRTITEQAIVPDKGLLIRTTVYSPTPCRCLRPLLPVRALMPRVSIPSPPESSPSDHLHRQTR